MKKMKYVAFFVSCFVFLCSLLSPVSRVFLSPDEEAPKQAALSGEGLAPATPPNMESSSGRTAVSPTRPIADGELRADIYGADWGSLCGTAAVTSGFIPVGLAPKGGARRGSREVMLC